jgi:predicted nuclease of predicted toxin-antitoxin system
MRFLFDQNISHRILKLLPENYSDSTTVKQEGLINAPDRQIWEFARQYNYVIVTQDSDFNDLTSLFGFPPKIIWIRTGNIKTQSIINILIDYSQDIDKFIKNSEYGCFEIFRIKNK